MFFEVTNFSTQYPSVSEARHIMELAFAEDIDKFNHTIRVVALTATSSELSQAELLEQGLALAYLHDVAEDLDFNTNKNADAVQSYLTNIITDYPNFGRALCLLTHTKEIATYLQYIRSFNQKVDTDWGWTAKQVKIADMKDHLLQTDTLTEKLKQKYLSAIPYLL